MSEKIDLGKLQDMFQGVMERSADTPEEIKARIDREKAKEQARLIRGYAELTLLCLMFIACMWRGILDPSDAKLAEWCRAGLLAILTYVIGRQVGKSDSDG